MKSYSILRDARTPNGSISTVVESGLEGYETADKRRNQLQAEYNESHPDKTYWTRDLFIVQMEKGKRQMTTQDAVNLLELPMTEWNDRLESLPKNDRMELVSHLSAIMERTARLKGYLEGRYMYEKRDHSFAVKSSNKLAERVRKLLGFAHPKQNINF